MEVPTELERGTIAAETASVGAPSIQPDDSWKEKEAEQKALEDAAKASVMAEWTEEAITTLKKARDGKRTFALCGFSPTSRHLPPFDDERVTIWGVNEAHRHKTSYMKRWDGWFQLHARWDFTKGSSPATKEHWEWLQQEHDFPIYMQQHWDDVPASDAFPLEEIERTFPGVAELLPSGEELERNYFTSTFAYMCSLAMLEIKKQELPGRIEIYGFDMATWTEFQYQKGSTEFWMGYARGMGIEVTVPYKCRLVSGKLYGFEVSRVIPKPVLQELLIGASARRDKMAEEIKVVSEKRQILEKRAMEETDLENRKKMIIEDARPVFNQEVELARELNAVHGEVQEYQDLIAYIDRSKTESEEMLINRQLLEFRLGSISKDRQKSMNTAMVMRGRRSMIQQDIVNLLDDNTPSEERDATEKKGTEAFQAEFDAAALVNAMYGRYKVSVNLIKYLDNIDPDDQIVKAIMDADEIKKEEGA